MTQFIIAYEHGGHTYTCKVDAQTWEEAERHLLALASTGRVSGEWVMDVPEVDDTALLRQALEALILAQSAIEDWGRYASEYFQKKHDLEGDVAGPAKTIAALRERLGEKT